MNLPKAPTQSELIDIIQNRDINEMSEALVTLGFLHFRTEEILKLSTKAEDGISSLADFKLIKSKGGNIPAGWIDNITDKDEFGEMIEMINQPPTVMHEEEDRNLYYTMDGILKAIWNWDTEKGVIYA